MTSYEEPVTLIDETSGVIPAERHIPGGEDCQRERFKTSPFVMSAANGAARRANASVTKKRVNHPQRHGSRLLP